MLALSPISYWPQTEVSGTTFADATGNGHTATVSGAAVVPGGAASFLTGEYGAHFAGSGQAFTAGGSFSTSFSSFTIEVWAQLLGTWSNTNDTWLGIILKDASGITQVSMNLLEGTTATEVEWFTAINDGAASVDNTLTLAHLECWNHYVISWDASGNVNSYINGALVDSRTGLDAPAITLDHMIWDDESALSKAQNVAHLALYDYALSSGQVAANYAAATPRQDGDCFGISSDITVLARVHRNQIETYLSPLDL